MRKRAKEAIVSAAAIAALVLAVSAGLITAPQLKAQGQASQSPAVPQWQTDAGGKMAFDVASVKQNKSGPPTSGGDRMYTNVNLSDGDVYTPAGGLVSITNWPLNVYIAFAYKLTPYQTDSLLSRLPKWATTDRFNIQARAAGNPTKDQLRLMMQSLLADRFELAIHIETRQLPVFELVLVKPGKTGPQLQPHSDGSPCAAESPLGSASAARQTVAGGFPALCGAYILLPTSGRMRFGARNVTLGQIAGNLPGFVEGSLSRAVLDQTGLAGKYDFSVEFTPESYGPMPPGVDFQPDPTGPTFLEALQEQLGLKLVPKTGPVHILVIDHIEEPSPN